MRWRQHLSNFTHHSLTTVIGQITGVLSLTLVPGILGMQGYSVYVSKMAIYAPLQVFLLSGASKLLAENAGTSTMFEEFIQVKRIGYAVFLICVAFSLLYNQDYILGFIALRIFTLEIFRTLSTIETFKKNFKKVFSVSLVARSIFVTFLTVSAYLDVRMSIEGFVFVWVAIDIVGIAFLWLSTRIELSFSYFKKVRFRALIVSAIYTLGGFGLLYQKSIDMSLASTIFNELELSSYGLLTRYFDIVMILLTTVNSYIYVYLNRIKFNPRYFAIIGVFIIVFAEVLLRLLSVHISSFNSWILDTQVVADAGIYFRFRSYLFWLGSVPVSLALIKEKRSDILLFVTFSYTLSAMLCLKQVIPESYSVSIGISILVLAQVINEKTNINRLGVLLSK